MISVWPSIIYISLTLFGMGTNKDWSFSWCAAQLLVWSILWWGGFFDPVLTKLM